MSDGRRFEAMTLEFGKLYGAQPTAWFRAPGRVDLMGSHTDYNDGYVATMTVDRDTWIAIRPRADRRVAISSVNLAGSADFSLDDIERDEAVAWTNYVRGVAQVLQEDGEDLVGFDGLLHSTVPFGSGLSSSAAIEIATLLAFDHASGRQHERLELALLGQRVENEFVGRQLRHPRPVHVGSGLGRSRSAARLSRADQCADRDRRGPGRGHLRHPGAPSARR